MRRPLHTTRSGFSLIEMLISLALFSVVITMSVGSLLVLIGANVNARNTQMVMTNLTFALDSMTRDLRTGLSYYCDDVSDFASDGIPDEFNEVGGSRFPNGQDCDSGKSALSFVESGGSLTADADGPSSKNNRITFFLEDGSIMRRLGTGEAQPVTTDALKIDTLKFYVTGANESYYEDATLPDRQQPSATIYIDGEVEDPARPEQNVSFQVQTTVTQRTLDL